ncbi:MAG TPA: prolyl oligopeptidase family serine peptidase, partial [Ktedonobacterales bacterium]
MTPAAYLDALLALPGMVHPLVSRDGRWVAWTWYRAGPAADVYVAPTDGSAPPVRLTDTAENTLLVSWTPDSAAVLVEEDHAGDERVRLFRVDLERPLAMVPLTEAEPKYFLHGGELHPNGRWLVYGANVDLTTGREIEPTWIYRHDLTTGERRVLARPVKGGYVTPALSPTGTHVLYPRLDRHPAGRQIWLVDIEGQEDREILNFGPDVKVFASWFPDGRRVVVLAETPMHRRLGVWELESGALRWLVDDPARNIEHAYVPEGSPWIVLDDVQGARSRSSLLDPETGHETRLPEVPGTLAPLAPADGGAAWVGLYASSRQPADAVRFTLDDPQPERFVSLGRVWERTALTASDLTPAEDFRWRATDGLEIQGWLYRTAQRPARGTVVYVHGGPTSHSQDLLNTQIQLFAHEGFNVLDPNYRGSTGFGVAFREAIRAQGWGGPEQDDIRAGVEALLAAGIATPGKVGITGTSYGGYSSWCAITRFSLEIVAASAPI